MLGVDVDYQIKYHFVTIHTRILNLSLCSLEFMNFRRVWYVAVNWVKRHQYVIRLVRQLINFSKWFYSLSCASMWKKSHLKSETLRCLLWILCIVLWFLPFQWYSSSSVSFCIECWCVLGISFWLCRMDMLWTMLIYLHEHPK